MVDGEVAGDPLQLGCNFAQLTDRPFEVGRGAGICAAEGEAG